MTDVEELARALEYPWERWTIFLHPAQQELVQRRFRGPARIAGSAGTGKTVVALHRAAHLARTNPDARVLLTTFSETLASSLRIKLARLIGTEPRLRERIDVDALDSVAGRLHERMLGRSEIAAADLIRQLVNDAAHKSASHKFAPAFLLDEWNEVVDARQIDSWERYRAVERLGRKTRLPEPQRAALWEIFERVRTALSERDMSTLAQIYGRLTARLARDGRPLYDFLAVDEAQDVSVPQLRFVASLGGGRPDALFFAGDLGQRIFQMPFSWRSLGVDVRGRSATLRINYRTSHQIRRQADRLLGQQISDVDGNVQDRRATISVFNGPEPVILVLATAEEESDAVGRWLAELAADGVAPGEMAVFVRSAREIPRARASVEAAGLAGALLDEDVNIARESVSVGIMPLSKGLELRAVAVMACDDEVLPLQTRIESAADESDLENTYETERHLLYVTCTRARDHLLVTGVAPSSEFLQDLRGE
jgi:superfamily I DNA/RNA helicase